MANNIVGTVGVGAQSVKPDWNQNDPNAKDYIKNRPGGYVIPPSVEITWDGDMTGKETVDVDSGLTLVKIADEAPPIEKFAVESGAKMTRKAETGPSYAAAVTIDLGYSNGGSETRSAAIELEESDGFWISEEELAVVIGVTADHATLYGLTLPKGLWFSVCEEVEE